MQRPRRPVVASSAPHGAHPFAPGRRRRPSAPCVRTRPGFPTVSSASTAATQRRGRTALEYFPILMPSSTPPRCVQAPPPCPTPAVREPSSPTSCPRIPSGATSSAALAALHHDRLPARPAFVRKPHFSAGSSPTRMRSAIVAGHPTARRDARHPASRPTRIRPKAAVRQSDAPGRTRAGLGQRFTLPTTSSSGLEGICPKAANPRSAARRSGLGRATRPAAPPPRKPPPGGHLARRVRLPSRPMPRPPAGRAHIAPRAAAPTRLRLRLRPRRPAPLGRAPHPSRLF